MDVHLRHFAVLRERRGASEETVSVAEGTSVGELYATLFPLGTEGALPVLFAVNRVYVTARHALAAGDEVAFIPPLGGG